MTNASKAAPLARNEASFAFARLNEADCVGGAASKLSLM